MQAHRNRQATEAFVSQSILTIHLTSLLLGLYFLASFFAFIAANISAASPFGAGFLAPAG